MNVPSICLLSLLASLVTASQPPKHGLSGRDVYVPPILYPNEDTEWNIGSTHDVVWDVSNPPHYISNPDGMIVLAKDGALDLNNPLAEGFPITEGRHTITLPEDLEPSCNYQIVLIGDSGNSEKAFCIGIEGQ